MSNALFAWNNYVLVAGLSAASEAANLPATNLKTEIGSPSVAWQTATGTLGPPGAVLTVTPTLTQQSWRVFGVFRTNLTSTAMATFSLYNLPSTLVWSGQAFGPTPGYAQAVVVADQDYRADYLKVSISDLSNADGFINVPLCFAGPAWQPLTGLSYESAIGDDAVIDEAISRGGHEYPVLRWDRRRFEIAMAGIRAGEVAGYLEPLRAAARRGNNILFVPDVTSETIDQEAVYGRLLPTADVGFPYGAADRRSWRARITERL